MLNEPPYAELACISNFTFLTGASHPQELVARAAGLGYSAIAICDECSMAGVVRGLEEARRCAERGLPIQLIPGSSFRLENGSRLVLLPMNQAGYTQICTLVTRGRRDAPKGEYALPNTRFERNLDDCLALWLPAGGDDTLTAHWLTSYFPGRCWMGLTRSLGPDDARRTARLLGMARAADLPLTACGDVQMHTRSRRMMHDVLAAIRQGCPVSELGYRALPSGERHLRSRALLAELFEPEWLAESVAIARRCTFRLDELNYRYPREVVPDGKTASQYLRELVEAGIVERWGNRGQNQDRQAFGPDPVSQELRAQIEKELVLIGEMGYESYFLTVYDIVRFARDRGILCQGRGSAANSAVCFCLGITEVDPARMNMLFERFISRERDEPPDIDVDFEHERREEVIQYIYRKYGRDRAALAATVISYRPRSAIRDVAKALGFSLDQADQLARNTAWWDNPEGFTERIRQQGFDLDNLNIRHLVHLVQRIVGFPRHLSQHVGGFVISERPLSTLVPVENAAMADRTVIQWDKEDLETLGLLKVDCLALGMLTAIHRCLDLVGMEISEVPPEDPETYAMIQQADTVGVFQIESRAQMAMLPRLKPACFYDLVIEVAIVRPGPIQGNMVHPYLQRRRGLEQVDYPSSELRQVLDRTLGVPIFQEQVMQIAMVAAGFSGSEADVLRRSMAAWSRRGGMEHVHQRLVDGMLERGYNEDFAEQIFQQIRGFGEYGFPESHAASFALLVYVSAWLKRHHPAAFTCALLNAQPMGFYPPAQLVQDVQRHGVKVLPADVRYSDWDCTLENRGQEDRGQSQVPELSTLALDSDPKISLRLGLRQIKGMRQASTERITAARQQAPFLDVQDLAHRAILDRHDLAVLAEAAALRALAGHRHRARWEVAAVEKSIDDLLTPSYTRGGVHTNHSTTQAQHGAPDLSFTGSMRTGRSQGSDRPTPSPIPQGGGKSDTHPTAQVQPVAPDPSFTGSMRTGCSQRSDTGRCPQGNALGKEGSGVAGGLKTDEPRVTIRPPTQADDTRADYASTGLTLGPHPVSLLRSTLRNRRVLTARDLRLKEHGSPVRACGLVTMRQRPMTASGTVFLTLEDETGTVNVVIWSRLFEKQRAEVLSATLLAVDGVLETDGEVHHLIAKRVHDFSALAGSLSSKSRDFC